MCHVDENNVIKKKKHKHKAWEKESEEFTAGREAY